MSLTTNLVILSSPQCYQTAKRSTSPFCSSPLLASPRTLLNSIRSKPVLKTGSRATPIAPGSLTGFRSASALLKDNLLTLEPDELEKNADEKTKKLSKQIDGKGNRKPRARKPRKNKEALLDNGQKLSISEASVDRPSGRLKRINRKGVKTAGAVTDLDPDQTQLSNLPVSKVTEQRMSIGVHSAAVAENTAQKRKTDWTPPNDTCNRSSSETQETVAVFKGLQGLYGFNNQHVSTDFSVPDAIIEGETISKRRRIEVVRSTASRRPPKPSSTKRKPKAKSSTSIIVTDQSSNDSIAAPPATVVPGVHHETEPSSIQAGHDEPDSKPKRISKSSRTITSIAIAQYKVSGESETTKLNTPIPIKTARSEKKKKPSKKPSKKPKPAKPLPPKLLSPESAQQKLTKQNYLFCTSSQMPEDSAYIRDLQLAMQRSENNAEFESIDDAESRIANRKLWSVAARNEDNLYLPSSQPEPRGSPSPLADQAVIAADAKSSAFPPPFMNTTSSNDGSTLPAESVPEHDSKAALVQTPAPITDSNIKVLSTILDPSPRTPKKARGRPRKQSAEGGRALQPPNSKAPKSTKFASIDEIEDSETDLTPSPPHRTSPMTTLPLAPSPSRRKAAAMRSCTEGGTEILLENETATAKATRDVALQLRLFPLISAAVKASPRTRNITELSWYEKILLYDPIVLEDLTAWLNEDGRLYREEEGPEGVKVDEKLVQKWCWANSICCMWKEGWRGGARKM